MIYLILIGIFAALLRYKPSLDWCPEEEQLILWYYRHVTKKSHLGHLQEFRGREYKILYKKQ